MPTQKKGPDTTGPTMFLRCKLRCNGSQFVNIPLTASYSKLTFSSNLPPLTACKQGSYGTSHPMNRSLSSTLFVYWHNFFFSRSYSILPAGPSPEAGPRSKIRRDLTAGWLPKLLFVLTKRRHTKLYTDESSHSPDVVSVKNGPHSQMTEILSIIPPTFNIF